MNIMKFCDLHTHSNCSDGSFSPAEIIAEAKKSSLTVALTDHDTIKGLPEFMSEAEKQGVTAVAGIEISANYEGNEIHLLGLFIEPQEYERIEKLTAKIHSFKEISHRNLIKNLNAAGYDIDYEAVKKHGKNNLNRVHFALELCKKGYVSSITESFEKLLDESKGFYVPGERVELTDAIKYLRESNVLPVLAHPLQYHGEKFIRKLLPDTIKAGLVGIEIFHSSYDEEKQRLAAKIAEDFGLAPSGGSDFHGERKEKIRLGTGAGNLAIPIEIYENLLKIHKKT